MIPKIVFMLLLLAAATLALAAPAADALHALFAAEWERSMKENPTWASALGDRRYDHLWPDRSLAAIDASHQADRRDLAALLAIDAGELSAQDRLNHELFRLRLEQRIEAFGHRGWLMPVSHRGGVQTLDELGDRLRFTTVDDYENWLERLASLPVHIEQVQALLEMGLEQGRAQSRVIMQRVPRQIRRQIVENPEDSLFYSRFASMPDSIAATDAQRLKHRARQLISERVVPAYGSFLEFFESRYLPACHETIGISEQPGGRDFYEFLVRSFTTTDMAPADVHAIGLAEVARIRGEMDRVIGELGYDGTFNEFLNYLRTDPRFYFDNAEDLLKAYRAAAKRIDPELVRLFGRLPRIPYGVTPIPDNIAPDTTTAYYMRPAADGSRAGFYYVNLYRPEVRPKYEIEVLTVHEAMPGHHLQIALSMELADLPKFRRYSGFTAFVEGWGLYSERLGYEMGLYQDLYSEFGALTYDMWRAVRLVVDTGMHYEGWSRQQAIDYFMQNAAKTEADIVNEIDRYISWPGQALAYKVGQMKLSELRARAETVLGERFDVRAFHDEVLSRGALPLSLLEAQFERWLADQAS